MAKPLPKPWSVEEFLAWEAQQTERHEYVDGVVVSMAGSTLAYAAIRDNLTVSLKNARRDSDCRSFSQTVKVVTLTESFYPDIVVTCAPVTLTDDRISEPEVIVEVLSRTTADRVGVRNGWAIRSCRPSSVTSWSRRTSVESTAFRARKRGGSSASSGRRPAS